MITPRIVSPHPNRLDDAQFGWPEAVAVCVEAEPQRWDQFAAKFPEVPAIDEAKKSDDPGWRFAHAVHAWVTASDFTALKELRAEALPDDLDIASAILMSIALEANDQLEDALAVLNETTNGNELTAGQGWLSVHIARCLAELGKTADAVEAINQANLQLGAAKDDVTMSAIRSAAIWLMFELTDPTGRTIPDVVPSLDNAASWWRTQSTAAGLGAFLNHAYRGWSEDNSVVFAASDVMNNELYSAALLAKLTGLHGQWRTATSTLARANLIVKGTDQVAAGVALDALRRSAKTKEFKDAVRRTKRRGPVRAIAKAMESVRPELMTRSSCQRDLEVLSIAGSYCSEELATHWLSALSSALTDAEPLLGRFAPKFQIGPVLLNAIAGLAAFATEDTATSVVDALVEVPDTASEVLAGPITRVLEALPIADQYRQLLGRRAVALGGDSWLGWSLATGCGRTDVTKAMFDEALLGANFDAAGALKSLTELSPPEAAALSASCVPVMEQMMTEIPDGVTPGYTRDYVHMYTWLELMYGVGDRDFLPEFLKSNGVRGSRKSKALSLLSAHFGEMSDPDKAHFSEIAAAIPPQADDSFGAFFGSEYSEGARLEFFAESREEGSNDQLSLFTQMMTGEPGDRVHAATFMSRRPGYEMQLAGLLADSDDRVSEAAVRGLTRRLCEDPTQAEVYSAALAKRISRGGEDGLFAFLGVVRSVESVPSAFSGWYEDLASHPSKFVRAVAADLHTSLT